MTTIIRLHKTVWVKARQNSLG